MRDSKLKKLFMKLMRRDSLERMPVAQDTTLMSMLKEELVPIFAEKNLLLSNPSKVSQVDQD